jgi:trehalose 6-phosphate phosphatase
MAKRSAFEVVETLAPENAALFLDFDGTLVDIVERPGDVRISARNLASLLVLAGRAGGALAIVSGRSVETIDGFVEPHRFATSGVHGFEMRHPGAEVRRLEADLEGLERVVEKLQAFAEAHDGLIVERKPASVSLHYRQRPELGVVARDAVDAAVAGETGLRLLPGKMVLEVKAHRGDKGLAIEQFMAEAPFAGRVPVFIGDDVTDEAAFRAVNGMGGVSIKVGDGETAAAYVLADTAEVARWLEAFAGSEATAIKEDTGA